MTSQDIHSERQHHIDMQKGDVAPTVLIPGDPGRVELFASLMDEANKVAEKREYITYTGKKDGVPISCTSTDWAALLRYRCGRTRSHWRQEYHPHRNLRCHSDLFLEPGHMIIATGAVRGEHTSEDSSIWNIRRLPITVLCALW
jgi:uridine phosphorylase